MQHPEALWIDLLRPDLLRSYSARPERLYDFILGNPLVINLTAIILHLEF